VKFHHGARLAKWGVLVVVDGRPEFSGPNDDRLRSLIRGFADKFQRSGMVVSGPPLVKAVNLPDSRQDQGRVGAMRLLEQKMAEFGPAKDLSILFVILSRRDDYIYPAVKRIGGVNLGMLTQCILTEKALKDKGQDQYFSNVALKVNIKAGGVNHRLDTNSMKWLTTGRTMMVGIDVTHPSPTSIPGTPSIAGVVASIDQDFAQFPASLRLQKSKQEVSIHVVLVFELNRRLNVCQGIAELKAMMIERLQAFRKRSNALPDRVLIFRDGVSEVKTIVSSV
jgi:eukaryotic translation initiation factor 2C